MASQKRSLTSILRELHQQLDPDAPRHLPLAERRTAVAPLLETLGSVGEAIADAVDAAAGGEGDNGGGTGSGRSSEGGTARRAGTRTGDADRQPQSKANGASQQRREARGVRVVTPDEPAKPEPKPAPKPVVKQPVTKPARSGDTNFAKLWKALIG